MDGNGLKDRIGLLLEIAREPLEIGRIVQIVSPTQEADVRSAILELVIEGKITAGPNGVALAVAGTVEEQLISEPDSRPAIEQEPEPELVTSPEIESKEQEGANAGDSEERGGRALHDSEEELPAWPWPELADEPYDEEPTPRNLAVPNGKPKFEELPEWPWPEFADDANDDGVLKDLLDIQTEYQKDSLSEEISDEDTESEKTPLFYDDPVDLLPMPKNSISKIKAIGVETIADLVKAIHTPRFYGLTRHVQLRTAQALRELCEPLHYGCEPEQLAELQRVSGSDELFFDIFGMLVSSPDSGMAKAEDKAASSSSGSSGESGDLARVVQDPVLIRRLRVGGVVTLDDLLSKSDEELLSIRGFGLTKLQKVREALASANLDDSAMSPTQDDDCEDPVPAEHKERSGEAMALILDALDVMDPDVWVFWPESFVPSMAPLAEKVLEDNPIDPCSAFIDAFWMIGGMEQACRLAVPILFDRHVEEFSSPSEAEGMLPDRRWKTIIEQCVADGIWNYDEGKGAVSKRLPTLQEWLNTLDDRSKNLLELRFAGATLAEAGDAYGLTRERVRQLQTRLVERKPLLQEDEYLHLVDSYAISAKDFVEITGFDELAYGYLDIVAPHPKSDRKAALEMLEDEEVPEHVKQAFSHTKTDGYFMVYGKSVPARKLDITKAILANQEEAVSPLWLLEEYDRVLGENDGQDDSALSSKNERAYLAWLVRQPGILYAPLPKMFDEQDRSVRLYDDSAMDFSALVSYLESGEYENIDCSSALVFRSDSFSGLRERLDIRNEYELHVVIKRYCEPVKNLELGRCPMMTFGRASRSEQIRALVGELGPISAPDLTCAYEERYGVDASVVQANYLQDVAEYLVDGCYALDDTAASDGSPENISAENTAGSLTASELADLLDEFDCLVAHDLNDEPK